MRKRSGLIRVTIILLVASIVLSGAAFGETGSDVNTDSAVSAPEDHRWIPSVALYIAGMPEERTASAVSEVSLPQSGETRGFPWSVGGEAALASPVLARIALKPRLVLHAGGGYVLDGNDPVSSLEDPGNPPTISPAQRDPVSIQNQGSAVKGQAKPWVLTGGIGAQIEFEAVERTFFIRSSLEWMYRKDTIQGLLGSAEGVALDVDGNCAPCRTLFIDAEREKGYHSLGAGLEASVDGGRVGDFLVRAFASGRVYHILGDRKASLSPAGTWLTTDGSPTTRPNPQTSFNAQYEREPMHYRVGAGIQFLYQPE